MSEQRNGESDIDLTVNEAISEGIRIGIASELGQTGFNDDGTTRNHFEVFGWPKDDLDGWDEDNWLAMYLRNAYAKVVNDKPAFTTWRDDPEVHDTEDTAEGETTAFEEEVSKLARNHNAWSYCERVDRVAGIGQHGLLLLGFQDVAGDLDAWQDDARGEFDSLDDITGFKPILETQIEDIQYGGPDSERWGKPVEYLIDLGDDIDEESEDDPLTSISVHWTRVVDVPAKRPLDDEILARPRMEPVLNNLLDIEKTLGAAAEAAYRAADYGLHLNADPEKVDLSQGADELQNELTRYEQGLQRYLRTQGMEVDRLGGDIQDPSGIIERNLDAISAETGIPKRELRGNSQGEQAGAEQDEKSFFGMIRERRTQYATPHIVRKYLRRLIDAGVLSTPTGGDFAVTWPDLSEISKSEQADIESKRAQVVAAVPGLVGDTALAYLKEGASAIPEAEMDANTDPETLVDHSDGVQAEFERLVVNVETTPPEQAQRNAQKVVDVLESDDKQTDAMTDVGKRRARQLAAGESLSEDVIERMAQFNRHQSNTEFENFSDVPESKRGGDAETPWWEDKGTVAWFAWGGRSGVDWAIEQSEELDEST